MIYYKSCDKYVKGKVQKNSDWSRQQKQNNNYKTLRGKKSLKILYQTVILQGGYEVHICTWLYAYAEFFDVAIALSRFKSKHHTLQKHYIQNTVVHWYVSLVRVVTTHSKGRLLVRVAMQKRWLDRLCTKETPFQLVKKNTNFWMLRTMAYHSGGRESSEVMWVNLSSVQRHFFSGSLPWEEQTVVESRNELQEPPRRAGKSTPQALSSTPLRRKQKKV